MKLVFLALVLVFLKVVFLQKVYRRLPQTELRRRARDKQPGAAAIYKVVAMNRVLDLLLLIFGVGSGMALIIWSARYAWWLAGLVTLAMAWLLLWLPPVQVGGLAWRFAAWTAPFVYKILDLLNPLLAPLARLLPKTSLQIHTGAYELEDLLAILEQQSHQSDNRISSEELKIAGGALTFGSKKVSKTMTPLRKIKFVSESEVVGPMLLDELHKTGFSRFPVVKGSVKAAQPQVVGALYLKDIVEVGQDNKGKVADHTHRGAYFINESCSLHQALDAILKSHHHQLIVVNKFEETVGILTLEDVIEQIIGVPIVDEFDRYDNLRAVANIEAEREKAVHAHEVDPSSEELTETTTETPAKAS